MSKRDAVTTNISKARLKLLFSQTFFGTLTMQLKLVDATDAGWCPTAAVDGRNIFYNRDFFRDLDVDELVFVLCHEVLHVALDHWVMASEDRPFSLRSFSKMSLILSTPFLVNVMTLSILLLFKR